MSNARREKRKIERKYNSFKDKNNGLVDIHIQNLNDLKTSCKNQAANFGTKYLPYDLLKIIVGECNLDVNTVEKATNENNASYNTMINNMLGTLLEMSKPMNTVNIPIKNIDFAIEKLKDVYKGFRK